MKRRILSVALSAVLGVTTFGALPAEAAKSYANCAKLRKDYQFGVARSKKAANEQDGTGHYRPYVSKSLYRANSDLDTDKDGTACEVRTIL